LAIGWHKGGGWDAFQNPKAKGPLSTLNKLTLLISGLRAIITRSRTFLVLAKHWKCDFDSHHLNLMSLPKNGL
jgi:hypothetical protein